VSAGVVRRRLDGLASAVEMDRRTLTFEFESEAERRAFWERANPAQIALRGRLPGERYRELEAWAARLAGALNRARDGRLALESDYLLVLARRA
jgi:hypothetical protein